MNRTKQTLRFAVVMMSALMIITLSASGLQAQNEPSVDQLRQQTSDAETARDASKAELTKLEQQLRQIEQTLSRLKIDQERISATVTETTEKLKKQTEAATTATTARDAAQKAADEAMKAAEAAKKALADSTAAADKAKAEMAGTEKTLTEQQTMLASLDSQLKSATESVAGLGTSTKAARDTWQAAHQKWLTTAKTLEQTLKAAGQWVSFASEIAPILQDRCVACHNSRMSKGRLNLETYANLMQGGESGPAVTAGKPEESELHTQIVDGAMPKDAAPLTPEQSEIIKKWIALGAKLDAGIEPNAPLFRIMPKRPYPTAPDHYKVVPPVTAMAVSPDGKLMATSGYHEVLIWNVETRALVSRIGQLAERIFDLTFSPDGTRLAVAAGTPGITGDAKVFTVADGKQLADLVTTEDAVFGVAFSTDGTRLAVCAADRSLSVFETATWNQQLRLEDHADWVLDVCWTPDGSKLITTSRDKTSKVFDSKSGEAIATFSRHGDIVYAAAVLADGNHAATVGRDKRIRVWELATGKQTREIGGFGNDVMSLHMLPGDQILTGGGDQKLRLHTLADGKMLKEFNGATDWIYRVLAIPGARQAIAGSYDGQIRIWNIEDGTPLASFPSAPPKP